MKPRSERDKRYEEKHKNERKAKNVISVSYTHLTLPTILRV